MHICTLMELNSNVEKKIPNNIFEQLWQKLNKHQLFAKLL